MGPVARLKVAHKLLICGLGFVLPFMMLLYAAASGIRSGASRTGVLVLSAVTVAFAARLLFKTGRSLSDALSRLAAVAEDIAAGRLKEAEQRLTGAGKRQPPRESLRDETSELLETLRAMIVNLSAPLKRLGESGAEVSGSSVRMAASVKQLEATVVEQAASTNQVTATSKEIFATVQELAGTMRAVREMASQAASLANAGMESLKGINASMSELLEATAGISAVLSAISHRAASITRATTAITAVANRTNLISLNAAIEADKAGEHAAGFSVVAVEIRRLADQTAVAALDIEKMIGEMQAAVQDGVGKVSGYAAQARASSNTVAGITSDLSHAIDYTRQLEPYFEAVNNGMQMQSKAAGQILEAMQQLVETAGQTRESLREFRHIAEQMRATVEVLQSEVGRFSVA